MVAQQPCKHMLLPAVMTDFQALLLIWAHTNALLLYINADRCVHAKKKYLLVFAKAFYHAAHTFAIYIVCELVFFNFQFINLARIVEIVCIVSFSLLLLFFTDFLSFFHFRAAKVNALFGSFKNVLHCSWVVNIFRF